MQVILTPDDLARGHRAGMDGIEFQEVPVGYARSLDELRGQMGEGDTALVVMCAEEAPDGSAGRDAEPRAVPKMRAFQARVRVASDAEPAAGAGSATSATPAACTTPTACTTPAASATSASGETSAISTALADAARVPGLLDSADVADSPRARMEWDIDQAIARREFEVLLQPQIDLRTFQLLGAEILLRWHHPQRGVLEPSAFLPVAEASGQISVIGRWVLNTVCANYAEWREWMEPGASFAVNVSPAELRDDRFLGNALAILGAHEVPASAIEMELTETALLSNPKLARESMECFRRNGLRLALDDFGVGYSCLASLRDFPFTKIKIDRSFVKGIVTSNRSRTIVRSMIELGKGLRVSVNAEGVETPEQLHFLYEHGCEQVQGFLFGRPMPIQRFAAWARGYSGRSAVPAPEMKAAKVVGSNVVEFQPRAARSV